MVEANDNDPDHGPAQRQRFMDLIVPDSYTPAVAWNEIDELHLDYHD